MDSHQQQQRQQQAGQQQSQEAMRHPVPPPRNGEVSETNHHPSNTRSLQLGVSASATHRDDNDDNVAGQKQGLPTLQAKNTTGKSSESHMGQDTRILEDMLLQYTAIDPSNSTEQGSDDEAITPECLEIASKSRTSQAVDRKSGKSWKGRNSCNSGKTQDTSGSFSEAEDPEYTSTPGARSVQGGSEDQNPLMLGAGLFAKRTSRQRKPGAKTTTSTSLGRRESSDTAANATVLELERGQYVQRNIRPGVVRVTGIGEQQRVLASEEPAYSSSFVTTTPVEVATRSMESSTLGETELDGGTEHAVSAMAVTRDDLEEEVQNRILSQAAVGEVVDVPSKDQFISLQQEKKRTKVALGAVVFVAIIVIVVIVVVLTKSADNSDGQDAQLLMEFLQIESMTALNISDPSGLSLLNTESPQYKAYSWMVEESSSFTENILDSNTTKLVLQQYALATLYYSTAGDTTWEKEGHAFLTNPDSCSWLKEYSHCTDNLVSTLDLAGLNLTGTIPQELVFLDELDTLNLSVNNIQGMIPSNVYLNRFITVDLHGNRLEGVMPITSVPDETRLEYLDLATNAFTGALPEELYQITSMETLLLNTNPISGSLSSMVGNLVNLKVFEAGNTSLTGTIPSEFGLCTDLTDLYLSGSVNITGSIPDEIWVLPELQRLDTSYLGVQMALPEDLLSQMTNLEELNLSAGRLYGTIPTQVGRLTQLRVLDLSSNPVLSGTIPTEIGQLGALQTLDLSRASAITGPLPTEIGNLSNLEILWTFYSAITGQIPTEIGRATNLLEFHTEDAELSTSLPTELGLLTKLQMFSTMFNMNMYGTIPTELGLLTDLRILRVTGDLTGTLPTEMARATKLQALIFAGGSLTGTIPRAYGQLFELGLFVLERQQLTGTLPLTLAALTKMEAFDIAGNEFTGSIPQSYRDWGLLHLGKFNGNNFTGNASMNLCTGFNSKPYHFFADCDEFSDNCQCCTHCCKEDERGISKCQPVGDEATGEELQPPELPPV